MVDLRGPVSPSSRRARSARSPRRGVAVLAVLAVAGLAGAGCSADREPLRDEVRATAPDARLGNLPEVALPVSLAMEQPDGTTRRTVAVATSSALALAVGLTPGHCSVSWDHRGEGLTSMGVDAPRGGDIVTRDNDLLSVAVSRALGATASAESTTPTGPVTLFCGPNGAAVYAPLDASPLQVVGSGRASTGVPETAAPPDQVVVVGAPATVAAALPRVQHQP